MKRIYSVGCCLFAASLSTGVLLRAQVSSEPSKLVVYSRLVTLDVSVVDKQGNPVRDLTKADFTLYEGTRIQTLRNFEAFSEHLLAPVLGMNELKGAADLQRLAPTAPVTLLVLDELNTDFEDTAYAREALRRYLLAQPERLAQPTAFLVSTDATFQQVHDYTLSRTALLESLQHLKAAYPFQLMRTGGSGEGVAVRFAQTLASLQQIAEANLGHKARKNIVWVGRGFTSIDLRDSPDHQVQLVKGAAERTLDLLRDADVSLFTIDPTLSTTVAADTPSDISDSDTIFASEVSKVKDPFEGTVSFSTLAPLSGGRAFALNNDIAGAITNSLQQGTQYYTLAYVPTGADSSAAPYRDIHVRVDRPGLRVITRQGYFTEVPPAPKPKNPTQESRANGFDMGTALASGMTFTGLGLLAGPAQTAGNYLVEVNTQEIGWKVEPGGDSQATLLVAIVAMDVKGKPLAQAAKQATAHLAAGTLLSSVPFATLHVGLTAPPGTVRMRIVVKDQGSGRLGTAEVTPTASRE